MFKRAVIAILAYAFWYPVLAAQNDYAVIPVDTSKKTLSLFLRDESGSMYRTFANLVNTAKQSRHEVIFAMNAGMFKADGSPVGLLVIDGKEIAPLNTKRGVGNFYLKPNGVFALTSLGPVIVSTDEYRDVGAKVILATQSGPLLLKRGIINKVFDPNSKSKFVRNGVCAIGKVAYFVISDVPVNLYEFARYFKDEIGCKDALYLDGNVSSLYSKDLRRYDQSPELGPILGVLE